MNILVKSNDVWVSEMVSYIYYIHLLLRRLRLARHMETRCWIRNIEKWHTEPRLISVNMFRIQHNVENGTPHNASLPIGNHI